MPHGNDDREDELIQDEYYVPTARPARPPQKTRDYEGRAPRRERDYDERAPRRERDYDEGPRRPRRRKERPAWPMLLLGCVGGIVLLVLAGGIAIFIALRSATGGNLPGLPGSIAPTNYTQSGQIPLTFTTLSLLQINDPIGNVTVTVSPGATSPSLNYVKRVKATSSSAAQAEFSKMSVQASQVGGNTAWTIQASVPESNAIGSHPDAIDLTLALPQSAVPATANPPLALSITTSVGNINVTGASGLLNLADQFGNVTVNQATLDDGSHLGTNQGNVTFSGSINTTPAAGSTSPIYKLQCESGNINATLPANTNVTLDANTNLGKITSAFPIQVTNSSGGANYYGPLLASSGQNPAPVLTMDVSTGNVIIHQGG
jgi:hypothetical protein